MDVDLHLGFALMYFVYPNILIMAQNFKELVCVLSLYHIPRAFLRLSSESKSHLSLSDNIHSVLDEMIATLLIIVGENTRPCLRISSGKGLKNTRSPLREQYLSESSGDKVRQDRLERVI